MGGGSFTNTATAIPSPHYQLCHTTTTPTDHHRTNAQRFALHTQIGVTEKSSAPRRRTRPRFRSHRHAAD